jgi:hypothetical protein
LKDPITKVRQSLRDTAPFSSNAPDGTVDEEEEEEVSDMEIRGDKNVERECHNCGSTSSSRWRWILEKKRLQFNGLSVHETQSSMQYRLCYCSDCANYWLKYGCAKPYDKRLTREKGTNAGGT